MAFPPIQLTLQAAFGQQPLPPLPAWVAQTGTWGIAGNQAYLAAGASGIATVPLVADCDVKITLPVIQNAIGLVFRYQDANNYWALQAATGFATYNVNRIVAGVSTFMGNTGATGTVSGDGI